MLLTEYRPFQVDKQLVEASIRDNKPLIVSGVIQRAEAENQNGRIYPREILLREIKKYNEGPIKERRALGELDHPETSVVNLQNASHNILDVWWNGDDVMGKVEVLSTPSGNILKELLRSGIKLGISSRGLGSVKQISEDTVAVQNDFELVCWDFVSNPSTHGAFMKPMNESVGRKIKKDKYFKVNNIISEMLCDLTCKCALPNQE